MKGWYLPVGLIIATLGPILEMQLIFLMNVSSHWDSSVVIFAWQLILVLFIPLFIIAWQYTFKEVVLFSCLTALLDLAPLSLAVASQGMPFIEVPILGVIFVRLVIYLFMGYIVAQLSGEQKKQRQQLTQANLRLAQYASALEQLTVSRERNRLARELHDVLAHTLSGVAVELEAVKALWNTNAPDAKTMLDHSLQSTRDGLTETRRALQALRATPLEDLGLPLAIRSLAESSASRATWSLDLQVPDLLDDYPPDVEQCFYRVTQEALTNVSDHAGARLVKIKLSQENGRLKLTVSDDGSGFEPVSVESSEHYGLRGMRERAEMINGTFHVESKTDGGTTITLEYGETV